MNADRGRYLANMEGFTHELFGGDPEEIVLRAARIGEGATTLRDLARDLRTEAGRYERLHGDGWALVAPFDDGRARCRKVGERGEDAPGAAPPTPGEPPRQLNGVVEGAATLPEAAARLRAAADAFERLESEGRRLAEPVSAGRPSLE